MALSAGDSVPPARPVLVRQRAFGGQIGDRPPADAVGQIGGAVFIGRRRRGDQGCSAKQLHRSRFTSGRRQELPGGKGAHAAAGGELAGTCAPVFKEALQRPFKTQVGGDHPRRRKTDDFTAKSKLHAGKATGAFVKHAGEPVQRHRPERIGDTDLHHVAPACI